MTRTFARTSPHRTSTLLLLGALALPFSLQAAPATKPKPQVAPKPQVTPKPVPKPVPKAAPKAALPVASPAVQSEIKAILQKFFAAWEKQDLKLFLSFWSATAEDYARFSGAARDDFAGRDWTHLLNPEIQVLDPTGTGAQQTLWAQIVFDESWRQTKIGEEKKEARFWVIGLKREAGQWKIQSVTNAAPLYAEAMPMKTKAVRAGWLKKQSPRLLSILGSYLQGHADAKRQAGDLEAAARFTDFSQETAEALVAKDPKRKDSLAWTMVVRALIAYDQSKYEEAIALDDRALAIFEEMGDWEGRIKTLSNRGNALKSDGRHDAALQDYEKSLQLARQAKAAQPDQNELWRRSEAAAAFNMAGTLDELGRADESLADYNLALEIYREFNDTYWQAKTSIFIGKILAAAGRRDEALATYEQALAISKTIQDNLFQNLILQDRIGDLHLDAGRYDEAQKAYEESRRLAQEAKYSFYATRMAAKIANIHHLLGDEDTRPELALNLGHTNYIGTVAISPDGKTWASGSWDGTIKLWEATTGKLLSTLTGHHERVFDIAFSPDGSTLASASDDASIKLWSVPGGGLQRTLVAHDDGALSVAFSPDGSTLTSGGRDKKIFWWNPQTGKVLRTLQGHNGQVSILRYAPDGSTLASASLDASVRIWDGKTGALIRTLKGHSDAIYALAFSPDGSTLVSGSNDKTLRFWDAHSGQFLHSVSVSGQVNALAFSFGGHTLGIVHSGGQQVLDAKSGAVLRALENPYKSLIWDIAAIPNSTNLLGASTDKTLKLWDDESGKLRQTVPSQNNYIYWTAFMDDNATIAGSIVSDDEARGVTLWDAQGGALRRVVAIKDATGGGLGIIRNGKLILALDKKMLEFRVYDAEKQRYLWTGKHDKEIIGVTYSKDYKIIASCSADQTLKTWDAGSGKLLSTLREVEPFADADLSPDGKRAVFLSKKGTLRMRDVATGEPLFVIPEAASTAVAPIISGNGKSLVTHNPLKLWDASTGKLIATLTEKGGDAGTAAISRDGLFIAATSADATDTSIRVWDSKTAKLKWTLTGHSGQVAKLDFSPDGKKLASAGYDNTLRVWSTATGKLLATMIPVPPEAGGELVRSEMRDDEMAWLTVTPEGYYVCSEGADYAIQWRFRNRLVPFSDFEETFRRRDRVKESLAGLNTRGAVALTYARVAPALRFLSPQPQATINGAALHIEVEATDDADIDDIQFFTNGSNVPVGAAKVLAAASKAITFGDKAIPADHKVARTFTADLPLPPGESEVLVRAVVYDKDRNSAQSTLAVRRGDAPLISGDLHALCVGVSRYRNPNYNLQFAASDAQSLASALSSQAGKNYAHVNVTVLTDDKASAGAIRAALEKLRQNAKPQDTVLVFLSGHGVQTNNQFYFAPHGIVADDVENTGLPWRDVLDPLKDILGKKIVLADACHSGAKMGDEPATGEQILEASRRHKGIVVLASSSGDRYSYEIEAEKHGAFTVALLESLSGKADAKPDGRLTLPELESYLAERTSTLTEGRQQPHLVAQDFNPQTALAITK